MSKNPGFFEQWFVIVMLGVVWTSVLNWNFWIYLLVIVGIVALDVFTESFFGK